MTVLIIYDVARHERRQRLENILREAGFVFLFRNARWCARAGERGALVRRIRGVLNREPHRIVLIEVSPQHAARACWMHGSAEGGRT